MNRRVKRIELPSGRWWEIEKRPRWKHLRAMAGQSGAGETGQADRGELADETLAVLTKAWGFEEPVCPASVRNREPDDVAAVLAEIGAVMERLLRARKDRDVLAMELFAGLMEGRVPEAFEEAHLMWRTGWTWQQLQETPADVVELMSVYLSVVDAMQSGGSVGVGGDGDGGG